MDLLQQLVSIPSFVSDSNSENEIQIYLKSFLDEQKWFTNQTQQSVIDGRYNQLFYNDLNQVQILFCCHVDTVNVTDGLLTLREDNDKLYGLGTKDMKGGIVSTLKAIEDLSTNDRDRIALLFYVDEEYSGRGIEKFAYDSLKMKPKIIISPESRYSLGYGNKGLVTITFQIYGKEAHSARPHLGINAIDQAIVLKNTIEKIVDESEFDKRLGAHLLSVTFLTGGNQEKTNVVPDSSTMILSIRTASKNLTGQSIIDSIDAIDVDFKYEILADYKPRISDEQAISQVYSIFKDFDRSIKLADPALSGFNDAGILQDIYDCPVINFGPYGEDNHTKNEWISKSSLEKTSQALQYFIKHFEAK